MQLITSRVSTDAPNLPINSEPSVTVVDQNSSFMEATGNLALRGYYTPHMSKSLSAIRPESLVLPCVLQSFLQVKLELVFIL